MLVSVIKDICDLQQGCCFGLKSRGQWSREARRMACVNSYSLDLQPKRRVQECMQALC